MEQTHIKRQGSAGPGSNKLMGLNRQRGGGEAPSARQTGSPAKNNLKKINRFSKRTPHKQGGTLGRTAVK